MVQLKGKKLPAIVGPTATGKTDLSVALAEKIGKVELIYADSLAVYKYLDIGTDKPPLSFRERVPHHLVDFLDPGERWSAFQFRKEAIYLHREVLERESLPVVVGGTAFYLWALYRSFLFEGAPAESNIRLILERLSTEKLYALLRSIDPRRAQKIGKYDRKRLIRALEIFWKTGQLPSLLSPRPSPFLPLMIGIYWSREKLKERIRHRAKEMFDEGLVEEVEMLFAQGYSPDIPALLNFTYRPVVRLLQGKVSREEAQEEIVRGTFRFLKTQINWFKKAPVIWIEGEGKSLSILVEETYEILKSNLE
ncbi:MAG TPA: tRNA (adenosine(37)-N6)-dimethylallyltransferase MiaA [Candidatus Atribacteria bacterium]|nr:tRNA (adenosine(37)-N6)-dimethylallyltransferase MiaA [Candidatus Atribacteria bacterium]